MNRCRSLRLLALFRSFCLSLVPQADAKRTDLRSSAYFLVFGCAVLLVAAAVPSAQAQFNIVHEFTGINGDGGYPMSPLLDVNGTLYGTTTVGGVNGYGTLFKISGSVETILYSFGPDGNYPTGSLVMIGGNIYGTTDLGGKYGVGSLYEVSPSGTMTIVRSFGFAGDGSYPVGGLVYSPLNGGAFYGTTTAGGTHNLGTIFAITLSGVEKWLYSFAGFDGTIPQAGLFVDGGWLYGTASKGGANGFGTVFRITNTGTFQRLYSFPGGANGATPISDVVINPVTNDVYGTTSSGGLNGGGVVFALNASQGYAYSVFYTFQGPPNDGSSPFGGMVLVPPGVLYGTTFSGGKYNVGTLFELVGGVEQVVSFFPPVDGDKPAADLTFDPSSRFLYGTTYIAGIYGFGAIFSIRVP
jgi:uncharacterized repeat protein (TIGR03803 family)